MRDNFSTTSRRRNVTWGRRRKKSWRENHTFHVVGEPVSHAIFYDVWIIRRGGRRSFSGETLICVQKLRRPLCFRWNIMRVWVIGCAVFYVVVGIVLQRTYYVVEISCHMIFYDVPDVVLFWHGWFSTWSHVVVSFGASGRRSFLLKKTTVS